jgi:hypothetical protein
MKLGQPRYEHELKQLRQAEPEHVTLWHKQTINKAILDSVSIINVSMNSNNRFLVEKKLRAKISEAMKQRTHFEELKRQPLKLIPTVTTKELQERGIDLNKRGNYVSYMMVIADSGTPKLSTKKEELSENMKQKHETPMQQLKQLHLHLKNLKSR